MAKGEVTHIEFPADDVERARRFYTAVAGWEFGEAEGYAGYWMFRNGPGSGGGAGGAGRAPRVLVSARPPGAAGRAGAAASAVPTRFAKGPQPRPRTSAGATAPSLV